MSADATKTFELTLERTIRAKPERVWEAWTTPEQMTRWFAPEGLSVPEVEVDLRVGGRWKVTMREPGGADHVAVGVYRELDPPNRLVTTWRWVPEGEEDPVGPEETIITVELRAEGEGTRVVMIHEGFRTPESRDRHTEGWSSSLSNLESLYAGD